MKKLFILLFISCTTSLSMCFGVEPWETAAIEHILRIAQNDLNWTPQEIGTLQARLEGPIHNVIPANIINPIRINNGDLNALRPRDLTTLQTHLNELRGQFNQPAPPLEPTIILGAFRLPEDCPGVTVNLNHADYMDDPFFGQLPFELWQIIFSFLSAEDLLQVALAFSAKGTLQALKAFNERKPDVKYDHKRIQFYKLFSFLIEEVTKSFNEIHEMIPMYEHISLHPSDPRIKERTRLLNRGVSFAKIILKFWKKNSRISWIHKYIRDKTFIIQDLIQCHTQFTSLITSLWGLRALNQAMGGSGDIYGGTIVHSFAKPLHDPIVAFIYLIFAKKDFLIQYEKQLKHILLEIYWVWIKLPQQFRKDNPFLSIIFDQFTHTAEDEILSLYDKWSIIDLYLLGYCCIDSDPEFFNALDHNGLSPVCYMLRSIIREKLSTANAVYFINDIYQWDSLNIHHVTREGLTLVQYAATLLGEGLTQEIYDAIAQWYDHRIREEALPVLIVPIVQEVLAEAPREEQIEEGQIIEEVVEAPIIAAERLARPLEEIVNAIVPNTQPRIPLYQLQMQREEAIYRQTIYRNVAVGVFILMLSLFAAHTYCG